METRGRDNDPATGQGVNWRGFNIRTKSDKTEEKKVKKRKGGRKDDKSKGVVVTWKLKLSSSMEKKKYTVMVRSCSFLFRGKEKGEISLKGLLSISNRRNYEMILDFRPLFLQQRKRRKDTMPREWKGATSNK